MTEEEWRDIMVLGELRDGRLRRPTLELLNKARQLTDQLGGRLTCVLVGQGAEEQAEPAIHHGADQVLYADVEHDGFQAAPLVEPLTRLIQDKRPEILLVSATDMGRDLAPMLGARLETGVANECVDLELDVSQRLLQAKRHTFGDQLVETQVTPNARPQIASLRPGAAREGFADDYRFGDTEEIDIDLGDSPSVDGIEPGQLPGLDRAEVVVVGGRGVSDDDWTTLETLAEALGGAVGATRGAVHGERTTPDKEVSGTGNRIKPRLYLGFGVEGSFDHQLAIQDAEWVVAINRDDEAPLIKRADWALVGDAASVASALGEKLQARSD